MIMKMYSIKDRLQGFIPPVPFANEQIAQRWYKEMLSEQLTMRMSPEDFGLYYLGEWDSEKGKFIMANEPEEVIYEQIQNSI